jgi:hypothetical protein
MSNETSPVVKKLGANFNLFHKGFSDASEEAEHVSLISLCVRLQPKFHPE